MLTLAILLAPWPGQWWPLWIGLLAGVLFECIRSQKRIVLTQGELNFSSSDLVYWQKHTYRIIRQPMVLDLGIFLRMEETQKRKKIRLWLAADSMPQDQWRVLRQLVLQWSP